MRDTAEDKEDQVQVRFSEGVRKAFYPPEVNLDIGPSWLIEWDIACVRRWILPVRSRILIVESDLSYASDGAWFQQGEGSFEVF